MYHKQVVGVGRAYEEIGATFNGNEVKIRVPKNTKKQKELTQSQTEMQNMCTCGGDGTSCVSGPEYDITVPHGQRMMQFEMPDDICHVGQGRTPMNSHLDYTDISPNRPTCNVTPNNAPPGVEAHKVIHPDKDVFVLKIGKQADEPDDKGNIEVELVTPRGPGKPRPPSRSCKQVQCEEQVKPKKKKKKKGKKGGKGKKKKKK